MDNNPTTTAVYRIWKTTSEKSITSNMRVPMINKFLKNTSILAGLALTGWLTGCTNTDQPSAANDSGAKVSRTTPAPGAASVSRAALDKVVERHTLAFMKQQPVLSTVLDIAPQQVGGAYNNRLPDYSPDGMQRLQRTMKDAVEELSHFDPGAMDSKDALHLNILKVIENYYAGSTTFNAGYIDTWGGHLPYIVNQISGPLIDIPKAMQVQQRVTNTEDARDYLARLAAFEQLTEQVLEKVKADDATGVILPKKLYPNTLAYFKNFLAAEPGQHALVTTFKERLDNIAALPETDKNRLLAEATELVRDRVYPGYRKVAAYLSEQQQRAPLDDGIWAQPGGGDFYKHEIRYLGDSPLSAEAIHNLGLKEVERISTAMDRILKANGLSEGSVGERMIAMTEDPKFLYQDSDAGRSQLLHDLNLQVQEVMDMAPQMFATLPKALVEVRRIPPVSEAGEAGGFYTPPSLDGSRPGIYWINLRDMKATPSFGLKTLTYHEAVPGHHFQIALNMAQQDIGLLRQNAPFNTYVEGWALYAEKLAAEMQMYKNDPWGDLGRLQAELYRAVRLVVDTGLHAKKWTREQAIDYFYKTTGTPKSDVTAEVERYMAWPGQALGYKLGMLQFVELRSIARKALGEKFDLREFHDLILLPGARPMTLVKSDVKAWIESKKVAAMNAH